MYVRSSLGRAWPRTTWATIQGGVSIRFRSASATVRRMSWILTSSGRTATLLLARLSFEGGRPFEQPVPRALTREKRSGYRSAHDT